jgi:hypothetical protein
MMFMEIIVKSGYKTKFINMLCGQNAVCLDIKAGGTHT